MRKLLPYEQIIEERKDNMPLPNEDMAWHEMEKLLNEEDDDKIIAPPPRLWGCVIWLLPMLLLVGLAIWYFGKKDSSPELVIDNRKTDSSIIHTSTALQNFTINADSAKADQSLLKDSIALINSNVINKQDTISIINKKISSIGQVYQTNASEKTNNTDQGVTSKINKNKGGALNDAMVNNSKSLKISNTVTSANTVDRKQTNAPKPTRNSTKKNRNEIDEDGVIKNMDDFFVTSNSITNKKEKNKKKNQNDQSLYTDYKETSNLTSQIVDTKNLFTNNEDTVKKIFINVKDIATIINEKNTIPPPKNTPPAYYFGTGLGMQQQMPINGVSSNSFNYYGRQNILSEYIPSAIVRLYKKDKWFIQAEFKYGAPQYNKEFNFINDRKVDSGFGTTNTVTNTNFILKKSFYHQFPLSFHYNLSTNLSIGTGVVINKFFGAIAEKTINQRNIFGSGIDSLLFKGIVARKDVPDSNFKKVSFQTLLESQYKWKRLMFGLRYTIGITPYISYTDNQTGNQNIKYHQNFNVFFRYELWNNDKRSKIRNLYKQ
jgi:hypothetical protein